MSVSKGQFYEFGLFRLYPGDLVLLKQGKPVALTPKAVQTLAYLVEHRGKLVRKDELLDRIWPDTFVEEGILARNVSDLRKVLTDGTRETYICTVPKRGYRFVAPVALKREQLQGPGPIPLAVLPFRNLDGGKREYLGLGLADAIITRLAALRQIVVRPTRSVSKFAEGHHDLTDIASELQVRAVLDGTLQNHGDKIRLTLQLLNVPGGLKIWSDKLDQKFSDLFELEDLVAERIAAALALKLSGVEQKALTHPVTRNAEAYRLYLESKYFFHHPSPDGFRRAIDLFRHALELDPGFVHCYAYLSLCYAILGIIGPVNPEEVIPLAKAYALKALEFEETQYQARASLAFAKWHYDFEWDEAEAELRRLILEGPNDCDARHMFAMLLAEIGRFEEARVEITCAEALEPNSPILKASAALVYYLARQYDHAITCCLEALRLDLRCFRALWTLGLAREQLGNFGAAIDAFRTAAEISHDAPPAVAGLGHAYAVSGQRDQARLTIENLRRQSEQCYVPMGELAIPYIGLQEFDDAFRLLFRAVEEHSACLVLSKVDPRLDVLRPDPRFTELLRQLGLTEGVGRAAAVR